MKKTDSKTETLIQQKEKADKNQEPYEIIYADPRDEEIHLKFLDRAKANARIARWFLDYEYNQLLWSDGIFELLEFDPRKYGANDDNFLEMVHPDDRHIRSQVLLDLEVSSKPIEINYRLKFVDGRIKWINEICNTDFDQKGNPIRSYGTIQDITKYKLTEEAFKHKEERFKNLIESIPSGIAIIQKNRITFMNPAGQKLISGNINRSITGKTISGIIHPAGKYKFKKKFSNVLKGKPEPSFEAKLINLEGIEFDAEITLIKTVSQGLPAIELIMNDITERKRAEQKLIDNEIRLKELIATKDKFFSIIAHDLRSPFNSTLGFLDLLHNQYDEFEDTERKNYLKLINENTNNTLKLLENLLEWAKVQTGKISFEPKKQKLLPVVRNVAETLESALKLKNVRLKVVVPEELEIVADTNMLGTIFQNLVSNAIKYSFHGGIITITASLLDYQVKVVVSDNGIGMNEELVNKLFKINGHGTTPGTANEKGSGLGLIICKDFIDRHDGTIWAVSKLGKGSKIIFKIPQ